MLVYSVTAAREGQRGRLADSRPAAQGREGAPKVVRVSAFSVGRSQKNETFSLISYSYKHLFDGFRVWHSPTRFLQEGDSVLHQSLDAPEDHVSGSFCVTKYNHEAKKRSRVIVTVFVIPGKVNENSLLASLFTLQNREKKVIFGRVRYTLLGLGI